MKLRRFAVLLVFISSAGWGQQQPMAMQQPAADQAPINELSGSMVVIPAGSFRMGNVSGSSNGNTDELPVHEVQIGSFQLLAHEVTFDMWDQCAQAGVCVSADDAGWGRGSRPVINVSWDDVQTYLAWLNAQTGGNYRLPTEAEWEYAARAGSETDYAWGDTITCTQARYASGGFSTVCGTDAGTVPVKNFSANVFGLYDMHGNVWEWVQDCYHENYEGAPANGAAWTQGNDCLLRVMRGGSWLHEPVILRSALRSGVVASVRDYADGFRLAQDLPR